MYVTTKGMGAYRRRGMGEVTYDAEGMPVEDPANTTYGATSGGSYPLNPNAPQAQTVTAWLNANGSMVAIGGAAFIALLLVAKVGR